MSQETNSEHDPDMLDEYDFSNGVRGKYAGRFAQGSNVIVQFPIKSNSKIEREAIRRITQDRNFSGVQKP